MVDKLAQPDDADTVARLSGEMPQVACDQTLGLGGKRYFEEGAAVKKGDVIIELDKHLEELDVQRREYAMQLAKAELDRLQSLARKNTISVAPMNAR